MSNVLPSFDTRAYRRTRQETTPQQFVWTGADTAWQAEFRQQFMTVLGKLQEWERPALNPIVHEVQQCDGYRREAVEFTTRAGLQAFGWFLVPDDCPPSQPAILCLHGHGVGVDGLVGITPEEYSADFALQCVRRGYPTFALEILSFGRRRDQIAFDSGPSTSSCVRDSAAALMVGETLAGWRVWDAMRALDYLATRTEFVDPERMATMGISGGGLVSLFTAALDTRVAAAVVSGYFNTFADSVLAVDHCIDNFAPGLLALCEMPDIAALIAPRALFVESGRDDHIFPLAGFEKAVAQARAIFQFAGVPERFDAEVFDAGHRFHGVGAFAFLEKYLRPEGPKS